MKFYFELYCTVSKFNPSFLSDTTVLLNIFNPVNRCFCSNPFLSHCVKSVHIRSFFWSVFSRIQTEYKEILGISPHLVRMRENTDQKKLRIWTLFTQHYKPWLFSKSIFSVICSFNTPNKILMLSFRKKLTYY